MAKQRKKTAMATHSPNIPTGFGRVSREISCYLGDFYQHYCVGWQFQGEPGIYTFMDEPKGGNFLLCPTAVNGNYNEFGQRTFPLFIPFAKPDLLITLADWFVFSPGAHNGYINYNDNWLPNFLNNASEQLKKKIHNVWYFPIDSTPINNAFIRLLEKTEVPVVMSKYGSKELKRLGIYHEYIPHGVRKSNFHINSEENRMSSRRDIANRFRNHPLINKSLLNKIEDSFICFPDHTHILTSNFTQQKIGDLDDYGHVISGSGNIRQYKKLQRKYDGSMITFKVQGSYRNITCTNNHPILAVKRQTIQCRLPSRQKNRCVCRTNKESRAEPCRSCKDKSFNNIICDYFPARELNTGDFIAYPIETNFNSKTLIDLSKILNFEGEIRDDKIRASWNKNWVNRYLPLNAEFLELLGYYIAEGNCIKRTGIQFTINKNENAFTERIRELVQTLFGLPIRIYDQKQNKARMIRVKGTIINKIFSYFGGEYADKKLISKEVMQLNPRLLLNLVKGFHRGDGHYTKTSSGKRKRWVLTTTSEQLAWQLHTILERNKIFSNIRKEPRSNRKTIYRITVYGGYLTENLDTDTYKRKWNTKIYYDNYVLKEIKSKETYEDKINVYNLSVFRDNNYLANNAIVHNCFWGGRNQLRKMPQSLVEVCGKFAKDKEDVLFIFHTSPTPYEVGFTLPFHNERYGINDKVIFTESSQVYHPSNHFINNIINCGDVYLDTAGGEGFGFFRLESAACGLPRVMINWTSSAELMGLKENDIPIKIEDVISVNGGGETENIKTESGILVPPITRWTSGVGADFGLIDVDLAVEALNYLYDHRQECKRMGRKGNQFAFENYNWDQILPKWHDLIETIFEEYEQIKQKMELVIDSPT
nr:MAG: intein-glycogen phosphorylase [Lokiarchaeota virus Ratatoskr Meg22_1012]